MAFPNPSRNHTICLVREDSKIYPPVPQPLSQLIYYGYGFMVNVKLSALLLVVVFVFSL